MVGPPMVEVRLDGEVRVFTMAEFEVAVRQGHVSATSQLRSELLTDGQWRAANSLEFFKGLYSAANINHLQWFRLSRIPWLTMALVGTMVAVFYLGGPNDQRTVPEMVEAGAKALPLMHELGQWWRLLTANFLHASPRHLWFNVFFLFNLCGLAENFYRRIDVAVLLFASGLVAMAASTVLSALVSAGASGMLFGVWGAVAVFAYRYRAIIPTTYRRLFTWNLAPYAVVLLFAGLTSPTIDNFAHFAGLLTGGALGMVLEPRLLARRPARVLAKLGVMAIVSVLLWGLSLREPSVPLVTYKLPGMGLRLDVPRHWNNEQQRQRGNSERFILDNGVDVALVIYSVLEPRPVEPTSLERDFLTRVVAPHLGFDSTADFRVRDSHPCTAGEHPAICLVTEWQTPTGPRRMEHLLFARGFYVHTITFRAPHGLFGDYVPVWRQIRTSITLVEPDELISARRESAGADASASAGVALASALIHVGAIDQGLATLKTWLEEGSQPGLVAYHYARWLWVLKRERVYGLQLATFAAEERRADPQRVLLLVDYLMAAGQAAEALTWLDEALVAVPGHSELTARREQVIARTIQQRRFGLPKP